jgi:hypothetical protein
MRLLSLSLILAGLVAAPAHAGWFPADPIDGPSPAIRAVTSVDLARDGSGGLTYLKDENGVPHVFLSRLVNGSWRTPERVDAGIETAATEAVVSFTDNQRFGVAFISGGRLYGSVVPEGGGPLPAPQLLYADADPLRAISSLAFDMGINGAAYATFTAPGAGGSDVRAVRLQDTTWETIGAPLDVDPNQAAGAGKGRSQVAVAADGNAVVVYGETHPDGRYRIYGRRVTGLNPSVSPQEVSLPEFGGQPGGNADSPRVMIEEDVSYAWAVWRQDFGGVSRSITRRLVGSLWETPVAIDAGQPSTDPQIGMNGRGVGFTVARAEGGSLIGTPLVNDVFGAAERVDTSGGVSSPAVAITDRRDVATVWVKDGAEVRGRHQVEGQPFAAEALLTRPEFGTPSAPQIAGDRLANFIVAMVQGSDVDRRVTVAVQDRPPARPGGTTSENWKHASKPKLRWKPVLELWGPVTYRVLVDEVEIGRTTGIEIFPPAPLADGVHRWRLESIDQRGQATTSRTRLLRVDSTEPTGRVKISGKRAAGQMLKFSVSAKDALSGMKYVVVDYGDRTPVTQLRRTSHRYRAGKYTVKLKLVDRAGNVTRVETKLRIKKK